MAVCGFDLSGRIAVVTGAGRGIGRAIALGLAEAGADVAVCSRTLRDVEKVAREIRALGRRALPIRTDVREAPEVNNLIGKTVKELGGIDILVNNAGGTFACSLLEMTEKGWDALIAENLKSVFLVSTAAARAMRDQGRKGVIVNMASVAGLSASPYTSTYGAAKAAIISLTQSAAVEWAPLGIRVNCISPGLIETGTPSQPRWPPSSDREVPLRRLGLPEDIVGAVIFLASDASSYVTGSNLLIHGGPWAWNRFLLDRLEPRQGLRNSVA